MWMASLSAMKRFGSSCSAAKKRLEVWERLVVDLTACCQERGWDRLGHQRDASWLFGGRRVVRQRKGEEMVRGCDWPWSVMDRCTFEKFLLAMSLYTIS
jgi:hypothetical protein